MDSMNYLDFIHRKFRADNWESEVKNFITSLTVPDNSIWYKNRDLSKAYKELITLGYYVKYKFGVEGSIEFCLNPQQEDVDGWVFKEGKRIESIQVAVAHYDRKENVEDKELLSGKECCPGEWEADRFQELRTRVEQRIRDKVEKKYTNIDTLLIGVNTWFVRAMLKEDSDLKYELEEMANKRLASTQFKELAIVDADLVGEGGVWLIPNKSYKGIRN